MLSRALAGKSQCLEPRHLYRHVCVVRTLTRTVALSTSCGLPVWPRLPIMMSPGIQHDLTQQLRDLKACAPGHSLVTCPFWLASEVSSESLALPDSACGAIFYLLVEKHLNGSCCFQSCLENVACPTHCSFRGCQEIFVQ